jgi:hypothetical protein
MPVVPAQVCPENAAAVPASFARFNAAAEALVRIDRYHSFLVGKGERMGAYNVRNLGHSERQHPPFGRTD